MLDKLVVPPLGELLEEWQREHVFDRGWPDDVSPGVDTRTTVLAFCEAHPLFNGDEPAVIEPRDALFGHELDDDVFDLDVDGSGDFDGEPTAAFPRLSVRPFHFAVGGMEHRPVGPIDVNIPAEID